PSALSLHFFNTPPPPHISPLSLHDALPISHRPAVRRRARSARRPGPPGRRSGPLADDRGRTADGPRARRDSAPPARSPWRGRYTDRKSTRLNSSHRTISYAVFCLKKKKKTE